MTNHVIDESDSPFEYVNRPEVKENDTIELVTSNQQGYKKYRVVMDENNIKDLVTILDYDAGIFQEMSGGRRRKGRRTKRTGRKLRSRKSRSRKSKRLRRRRY